MGHALNGSIQDVLVRWHRMRGFDTLWQPGYDHAGIATQNVVEKELAKEGLTRHDLGREAFVERTWEWLEKTGRTIMGQYRRLGASLDYSRERFTMDDGYVRAVMTFFVRLWERGWIYRDNRIVNWCPFHQTAISDLEVAHAGDGRHARHDPLPVRRRRRARRRLGRDRAPGDDPRRRRGRGASGRRALRVAVGREVIVPYVERRVPGHRRRARRPRVRHGRASRSRPATTRSTSTIGRDHGLPEPMVVGLGRAHERGGGRPRRAHAGRGRQARPRLGGRARPRREAEPYRHAVGTCERCHSRIEPLISLQWWCAMKEPAAPAIEALQRAARPLPPGVAAPLRDRLARGVAGLVHLPPALVGASAPDLDLPRRAPHRAGRRARGVRRVRLGGARARVGRPRHVVLVGALAATRRSAGRSETPELARYYPGDVNSTAREIIRLWVNRMIWTGLEVLGDVPFTDSIIHSTVLAVDGRRMSKSLGTGIDPMEPIEEYGADATRYGLLKISSTQDVRFSYGAIEEGRKLANKLWNVSRLDPPARGGRDAGAPAARPRGALDPRAHRRRARGARGRMVALRLRRLDATPSITSSSTTSATGTPRRSSRGCTTDDEEAVATALAALERLLALLHPVMPHVTEEIWSQLPDRDARLIVSPWPEADAGFAADVGALDRVQEAAQIFRRSGVEVELGSDDERRIFAAVVRPERARVDDNRDAEIERLRKEVARAEAMLANERFVANAPAEVVAAEREKLERYRRELAALEAVRAVTAVEWLDSMSPWPRDGFGLERMRAAARRARRPAGGVPGDPRRRHEREVDGDDHDRAAAPLRRPLASARRSRRIVASWSERIRLDGEEADFETRSRARPARRPRSSARPSSRRHCGRAARRSRTRGSTSPSSRPASAGVTTRRTSCAPASCCSRTSGSSTPTSSATRSRRSRPRSSPLRRLTRSSCSPTGHTRTSFPDGEIRDRRRARGSGGIPRPADPGAIPPWLFPGGSSGARARSGTVRTIPTVRATSSSGSPAADSHDRRLDPRATRTSDGMLRDPRASGLASRRDPLAPRRALSRPTSSRSSPVVTSSTWRSSTTPLRPSREHTSSGSRCS